MKIKMLTPMGGINVQRNIGDECEVSAKEAERLFDAGFAEPLNKPAKARTAVKRPAGKKVPAKKPGAVRRAIKAVTGK